MRIVLATRELFRSGLKNQSRSAKVSMVKTADTGKRDHFPSSCTARALFWSLLLKSAMRAVLMVIVDVGSEQSLQVQRIDGNDAVQQFAATAADPRLRHPVLPRTADRSTDWARCPSREWPRGSSVPYLAS